MPAFWLVFTALSQSSSNGVIIPLPSKNKRKTQACFTPAFKKIISKLIVGLKRNPLPEFLHESLDCGCLLVGKGQSRTMRHAEKKQAASSPSVHFCYLSIFREIGWPNTCDMQKPLDYQPTTEANWSTVNKMTSPLPYTLEILAPLAKFVSVLSALASEKKNRNENLPLLKIC